MEQKAFHFSSPSAGTFCLPLQLSGGGFGSDRRWWRIHWYAFQAARIPGRRSRVKGIQDLPLSFLLLKSQHHTRAKSQRGEYLKKEKRVGDSQATWENLFLRLSWNPSRLRKSFLKDRTSWADSDTRSQISSCNVLHPRESFWIMDLAKRMTKWP